MKTALNIFWFRRDLRLIDNTGLFHALQSGLSVLPLFIFDRNILDTLENRRDARVEFIHQSLMTLQDQLALSQSSLEVYFGTPLLIFSSLSDKYRIVKVFANEDYEPYAKERDEEVEIFLKQKSIEFQTFRDQVIFSKKDVLKQDGLPYTVFTPYSNKWKSLLNLNRGECLKYFPIEKYLGNFFKQPAQPVPDLAFMGFSFSGKNFPSSIPDPVLIKNYGAKRDFPGLDATSHLGIHLRFGTISIRQLAAKAIQLSPEFLNELVWRDFYHMILWYFPKVGKGHAFKSQYEKIPWRNNEKEFTRWCEGNTGYPLVDAGMRQLNETGFMHNRLRMVTASFLSKHLLIDWRWGEAYFAEKLLDFDLAANNGGWQWAAGCGCDAAPYFRVFNPALQQKKFDPTGIFIERWLPGYQQMSSPEPIVEHVFARNRVIAVYKKALAEER